MKVLIAEDDKVTRRLLEKYAVTWGFEAIVVTNGQEALDQLSNQTTAPRLAILDWQMPEVDGIDVCRQVKRDENRPFTYVIMLTSRDSKEDMVSGLDSGADHYLTKPVDPLLLRSHLQVAKRIIEAIPPKEWSSPKIPGYQVDRLLGKGAFATVWKATRDSDGLAVALKILRVDLATDQVFYRFSREVESLRLLNHKNVAKIYDSHIDRKVGFYAMELIDGATLDTFVKTHKPNGVVIIQLMYRILDGLHHAHSHGVIHRDLKPSNVMVGSKLCPKIVDFGLCKSMFQPEYEDNVTTIDGAVIGSPLFMAPEQARAQNLVVDQRSDIYSAGIILYMLLLRRHPHNFDSSERWETIKQIATGHVSPPSEVSAHFNKGLEQIIMKALADSPDSRYQDAASFARDLRLFVANRTKDKQSPPEQRIGQ